MNQELSITETRDAETIWKIVSERTVFNSCTDDNWMLKSVDELKSIVTGYVENPVNHTVLFTVDSKVAGCFVFLAIGAGVFDMHSFVLKPFRGKVAIRAAKDVVKYLFTLVDVMLITGNCPMHMPQTLLFIKLVGFKVIGLSPLKWLKNGAKHDMMTVAMEKGGIA